MTTLRFRSTDLEVPARLIAQLRRLTNLSISDIRNRAAAQAPLIDITPFQHDWQDTRHVLVGIVRDIEAGTLPLTVTEVHATGESPVPIDMLRNFIQHFREIELQTQLETMLEAGEISDPSEFMPHDDDWTR